MYVAEAEAVVLAELSEPAIGSLRIHRLTVPLCEQPVMILPLGTELCGFCVLFNANNLSDIGIYPA